MQTIKFYSGENVPMEMHKARMVQRVKLLPVEERRTAIKEAGFNTFLLKNRDVYLDMLTDSGVNAMSEKQYSAMFLADDSYAGSETFYRLEKALQDFFGTRYFLPAHQGRACENIIAKSFVSPGSTAIMNYHFTTTKALITNEGGTVEELISDEGLKVNSCLDFKGNMDMDKLLDAYNRLGKDNISFVRLEAGTNLIGGQPISMENIKLVSEFCRSRGLLFVFDASLLADNLYFIKIREKAYADTELGEITKEIGRLCDIIYFSARKLGCARGGGIVTNNYELFDKMRALVPLYEGFITYGGMSVREMEAIAVGLYETLDFNVIEQTPIFVKALSDELVARGIPVVTPAGGLGCHLDASVFCEHIKQTEYQSGALATAMFIAGGVRGMERGTLSEQRNEDGSERLSEMELLRLAVPKRTYTLSHVKYVADRADWLYQNRKLIGGLKFIEEPAVLRFFFGRLEEVGDWTQKLVDKFRYDFGDSL
jgi:tryptophanase